MVDSSCLEILCSYGESAGVLSILSTKKLLQHQPDGTHAPPTGPRLLHLEPKNYLGEALPLHIMCTLPSRRLCLPRFDRIVRSVLFNDDKGLKSQCCTGLLLMMSIAGLTSVKLVIDVINDVYYLLKFAIFFI